MAKPYSITITNGAGSESLVNDTYSVTAEVNGYDNNSINPSSFTVTSSTTTQAFTIAANGTLNIHVSETGTSAGTAVVGATFVRTDSSGNVYGSPVTSDSSGVATFQNVPYGTDVTIYYQQTASDGNHNFDNTVKSIALSQETTTLEVQNSLPSTVQVTLTDANYADLPIASGTITLS